MSSCDKDHQRKIIIGRMRRQIEVNDQYAKESRPRDTVGQTTWEICNGHIRGMIAELEALET